MSVTQNEKIRQVTDTTMVIGVDIASEIHWARAFDWRGLELGKAVKFENSAEGFHLFLRWASELAVGQKKDSIMVGLEPTGHYWFTLAAYLQGGEFKLALVNPYHVKCSKELDDGHPSKSDKKDPKTIAKLVLEGRYVSIHPTRAVRRITGCDELPLEDTQRACFDPKSNSAMVKNLLPGAW